MEVEAGSNLIKNITTAVTGNTLTIDNTSKCNFVRGYKHHVKVYVTVPYIKMASNEGVATLRFDEGFSQDTLVVRVSDIGDIEVNGTFNQLRSSTHGGGDTYVGGSANSFMVYTSGTNYVHAESLVVSDYVYIETHSLGNIYLNAGVLKQLDYDVASSGNILYSGQPAIINNYSKQAAKGRAQRID